MNAIDILENVVTCGARVSYQDIQRAKDVYNGQIAQLESMLKKEQATVEQQKQILRELGVTLEQLLQHVFIVDEQVEDKLWNIVEMFKRY